VINTCAVCGAPGQGSTCHYCKVARNTSPVNDRSYYADLMGALSAPSASYSTAADRLGRMSESETMMRAGRDFMVGLGRGIRSVTG
jgi:hypothetical protein